MHFATLLCSASAGVLFGNLFPSAGTYSALIYKIIVGLLAAVSLPFALTSLTLGIRRVINLPNAAIRVGSILCGIFALTVVSAICASSMSYAIQGTAGMSQKSIDMIGAIITNAEVFQELVYSHEVFTINDEDAQKYTGGNHITADRDNSLSLLFAASIVAGVLLSAPGASGAGSVVRKVEALHRCCEYIMRGLARLTPAAVFGFGAYFVSSGGVAVASAMTGFLFPFIVAVFITCIIFVLAISYTTRSSPLAVLDALVKPIALSLFSGSTTTSAPFFIDALVERLGLQRALVESMIPLGPFVFRAGDIIYIVTVWAFLSALYGNNIEPLGFASIGLLAAWCAIQFLSATSVAFLGLATAALANASVPIEGIIPLLLSIEIVTLGMRTTASSLGWCWLAALATYDIKREEILEKSAVNSAQLVVVPSYGQLRWILILALVSLTLMFLAGVGIGWQR